jgi:hypothetical protein
MMKMLARLACLSLVLTGCSHLTEHQKAYAVGAISKTLIDEADQTFWDPFVTQRTDECDPENNTTIRTKQDFDQCLGPARADEQVQQALEVYVKAAEILFAVLKHTEAQPDEVRSAKQRALDAAFAVLDLMGADAKPYLDNLKALTRGK